MRSLTSPPLHRHSGWKLEFAKLLSRVGIAVPIDELVEANLDFTDGGYVNPSRLVPSARLVLAIEYRFADRWVASLGLCAHHHFAGRTPWRLSVPLSVGYIWW